MTISEDGMFFYGWFVCGGLTTGQTFMAMHPGYWVIRLQGAEWLPCDEQQSAILTAFVEREKRAGNSAVSG